MADLPTAAAALPDLWNDFQNGNYDYAKDVTSSDETDRQAARMLQAYALANHGVDINKVVSDVSGQPFNDDTIAKQMAANTTTAPIDYNQSVQDMNTKIGNVLQYGNAYKSDRSPEQVGNSAYQLLTDNPIGAAATRALLPSEDVAALNARQQQYEQDEPATAFVSKTASNLPLYLALNDVAPNANLWFKAPVVGGIIGGVGGEADQYKNTGQGTTPIQTGINTGMGALLNTGAEFGTQKLLPMAINASAPAITKAGRALEGVPSLQDTLNNIRGMFATGLPSEAASAGGKNGLQELYQRETSRLMNPDEKQAINEFLKYQPDGVSNIWHQSVNDYNNANPAFPASPNVTDENAAIPIGVLQNFKSNMNPTNARIDYENMNTPAVVDNFLRENFPSYKSIDDAHSRESFLSNYRNTLPSVSLNENANGAPIKNLLTSLGNIKRAMDPSLPSDQSTAAWQALSPDERQAINLKIFEPKTVVSGQNTIPGYQEPGSFQVSGNYAPERGMTAGPENNFQPDAIKPAPTAINPPQPLALPGTPNNPVISPNMNSLTIRNTEIAPKNQTEIAPFLNNIKTNNSSNSFTFPNDRGIWDTEWQEGQYVPPTKVPNYVTYKPINLDDLIKQTQGYNENVRALNGALPEDSQGVNPSVRRDMARGLAGLLGGSPHYAGFEAIKAGADALGRDPAAAAAAQDIITKYVGGDQTALNQAIQQAQQRASIRDLISSLAANVGGTAASNAQTPRQITGGVTQ